MPDRYSDTSKVIHDYKDFVDIDNAISEALLSSPRAAGAIPVPNSSVSTTTTFSPTTPSSSTNIPEKSNGIGSGKSKGSFKRKLYPASILKQGTTTVSSHETPRSESKTPEITVTPGSEEDQERLLLGSGSTNRDNTDSGCAGLLEEENNPYSDSVHIHHSSQNGIIGNSNNNKVNGSSIRYVDGPLDGALYALVNPIPNKTKPPSSADSGISVTVDQMKDLDRLLNALVEDAESIPDVDVRPYHAREDSLPFSYGIPADSARLLKQREKERERLTSEGSYHHQHPVNKNNVNNLSHSHYAPSPTTIKPPYSAPPTSLEFRTSSGEDKPDHSVSWRNTSSTNALSPPTTYYQKVNQYDKQFKQSTPSSSQSPAVRVHNLHLDFEDRPRKEAPSHYSDSSAIYQSPKIYSQPHSSLSFNNFDSIYNNGRTNMSGTGSRFRSQSADGRSRNIQDSADQWLAKQKQRLEEKRARKYSVKNDDWLAELKRTLPSVSREERERERPSVLETARYQPLPQPHYSRSNVSTPAGHSHYGGYGFYSSDDEEFDREVEREMFHNIHHHNGSSNSYRMGGRRVQRYHSENAYDRIGHQQQYSQSYRDRDRDRAPSVQSNVSSMNEGGMPTPGFPTCPPTPYLNRPVSPATTTAKPPRSPKGSRRSIPSTPTSPTIAGASTIGFDRSMNEWNSPTTDNAGITSTSTPIPIYVQNNNSRTNFRAQTPVNPQPVFIIESEVKFTRDLSNYWYKPNASREETISSLRYQPVGAFIIRNSNSFPGAYGLAVKANENSTTEDSVRHFLIEPTKYGVRLRGSAVEPVFGSLSALVYAHSIEPMALPARLALPTGDTVLPASQSQSTTAHLLAQGAACQLLFLGVIGVECVTGDDGVVRGINAVSGVQPPTVVSLRLSKQGLTLTDIYRQRFFRLHFPLSGISYAATDPSNRTITHGGLPRKVFAVIARVPSASENSCIVLAELEEGQPANAIVAFFQRVIAWQN